MIRKNTPGKVCARIGTRGSTDCKNRSPVHCVLHSPTHLPARQYMNNNKMTTQEGPFLINQPLQIHNLGESQAQKELLINI